MRLDDVQRNYDRLAWIYDLADRWFIQSFVEMDRLRVQAVAALALAPGASVLDIGCGERG